MKKIRLVIFAKAPQPGLAKTRLIPVLGAEGAARLAHRMLEETLTTALSSSGFQVELCTTPAFSSDAWRGIVLPDNVDVTSQGEGDLGERMARVVERCVEQGESVILIGTDCIDLTVLTLVSAQVALETHNAVICPTVDGGYALLGLKRFDPSLFEGIAWSTSTVAEVTLKRMHNRRWSVAIGKTLHDIDVPDDLQWLRLNDNIKNDVCEKISQ